MNLKASVQALHYLSKNMNKPLDRWSALKLIFFADRLHLRKYARTITDDTYFAMGNGPVASLTYDIIKFDFDGDYSAEEYVSRFIEQSGKGYKYIETKEELDQLSNTDKESLDYVIKNFGKYSPSDLVGISHQYPEWKKFEKTFTIDSTKRIPMKIEDFFDTSYSIKDDPFSVISKDHVQLSKQMYEGFI